MCAVLSFVTLVGIKTEAWQKMDKKTCLNHDKMCKCYIIL